MAEHSFVVSSILPVADAFARLIDLELVTEWDDGIVSSVRTDRGPDIVGRTFDVVVTDFDGRRTTMEYEITESDGATRFVMVGSHSTMRAVDTLVLTVAAAGCELAFHGTLEIHGDDAPITDEALNRLYPQIAAVAERGLTRFLNDREVPARRAAPVDETTAPTTDDEPEERVTVRPDLTLLERTKVQAEVLVPLIKAMEAEFGTNETRTVVRDALGTRVRDAIRSSTPTGGQRDAIEWMLHISKAGDAQDHERLDGTDDQLNLDVTRCDYAAFFEDLGEPELGFLLVCSLDHDLADGLDGVTLDRSQTIMQGGDRCDFRFRLNDSA